MAFDYTGLADVAHELLVEFGREAVFRRAGVGSETFDIDTLTVSGASTVVASVIVADFDYETVEGGRFFRDDRPGNLIQTGDRMVLMSPKSSAGAVIAWEPRAGDTVVLSDGAQWDVKNLEQRIAPAGTNVLFILQARRGG